MEFLPLPVTMMMCSMPEATHSSTTYWICGLSTTVSISLGWAFVAGKKRVPRPAAGKTALRTLGWAADFCEDCLESVVMFDVCDPEKTGFGLLKHSSRRAGSLSTKRKVAVVERAREAATPGRRETQEG